MPRNNLTITETANLLAALKTLIERYGFDAVKEAIEHLQITMRDK